MLIPVELIEEREKALSDRLARISQDTLAAAEKDPTNPSRMSFGLPTGLHAQPEGPED